MRNRIAHRLASAIVIAVVVVVAGAGCAHSTIVTMPSCAQQFEVDGEHQRRGPRTIVLDHGLDAPWTSTEIVIDTDGPGSAPQEVVRFNNDTPTGGRLASGIVIAAVGGIVGGVALADMADGRIADYGPVYGVVFGSVGVAIGTFLGLTGWNPGHNINLEKACSPP